MGKRRAQATQAAFTPRRKGRDVDAQRAACVAWKQRRAADRAGRRGREAPHPGDHPGGAIEYAPPALSRPPAIGNDHHRGRTPEKNEKSTRIILGGTELEASSTWRDHAAAGRDGRQRREARLQLKAADVARREGEPPTAQTPAAHDKSRTPRAALEPRVRERSGCRQASRAGTKMTDTDARCARH